LQETVIMLRQFNHAVLIFTVALSLSNANAETPKMTIDQKPFGKTPDRQQVTRYTLTNSAGNSVSVMNWGATLLDVIVPDRDGNLANVNLSFDSLQPYLHGHPYFGSTVGRYCNRIGGARFTIDGEEHNLTQNLGDHHIHGGKNNFTYQFWEDETIQAGDGVGVRFRLSSPDGQEGYPGTVTATVDYFWNDANELKMVFTAETDAPTHVSLCNHSYWNLGGAGSGSALDHVATIQAEQYLDVDEDIIPTGTLNDITGTPLDFQIATPLGDRIEQLPDTKGYDHCYVVRGKFGELREAARVVDPKSGRVMEVETTQPGIQLYTANHLPGNERSGGYGGHEAFCLETQRFPNSPNVDSFPTTLLRPGDKFEEVTVHRFGVE
jgi:aldose 1-epimerase